MKWRYEVDVGTISGEVEAPDDDAAMEAANTDANDKAWDAINEATWGLWRVADDD